MPSSVAAEPIDLWEQVDAVLAARETSAATLTVERSGGEAKITADPKRVRQIIRNLLNNADRHGGEHVTAPGRASSGDDVALRDR